MNIDHDAISTEGLNVEVKSWIDPDQPSGAAKIIKAALALRNRGYLVIGYAFENEKRRFGRVP